MKRKEKLKARSSSGVCDAPHVRSGRGTAVSPSTVPVSQPNHTTSHPTTGTHIPPPLQQASKQAKPSRIRNTRSTKQLRKAVDTYLCISLMLLLRYSSSALVQRLYHPTARSSDSHTLKNAPTFLSNISVVMCSLCQNQDASG